jgi:hypothetical protein
MATEEERAAMEKLVAMESQWRGDVIELLQQIAGFAQAGAEAQHAGLAALAEIRALLSVEAPGEAGEPPELVSVADLLGSIAEDIEEAGTAANLLSSDPE